MAETTKVVAKMRDRAGKGGARSSRRDGLIPAVIYGDKQDPLSIHVEEKALIRALSNGHFMNTIVMVEVEGKQTRTLPRDVQFHPVTDRPLHVDFLRIAKNASVHVNVPVRFVNEEEAPGLTRGGVLNIVRHELELICDASRIPDELVIDLTGYELGDSIHFSAVTLPEGSRSAIEDRDFTIATVVAPSAYKQAEEEAAPAEGEEAPAEEAPEGEASEGGEES
jgi:large subunit ribosomal protein L25